MKKTTKFLVRSAVIAALYAALTFVVAPIAYTPAQFRVSEALTILPLFFTEAIPGLTIGCFIANIPAGPWDMLIGTAATLIAAVLTRLSRKIWLGIIPPVLCNAFLVPVIFLTNPEITEPYFFNVLTVGGGELLSVVALGVPLYFAMAKLAKKRHSLFGLQPVGGKADDAPQITEEQSAENPCPTKTDAPGESEPRERDEDGKIPDRHVEGADTSADITAGKRE